MNDDLTDGDPPLSPRWIQAAPSCIRNHPGREYLDESGNDEAEVAHAWHATDRDGWMT